MSENAQERATSRRWLLLRRALVPLACVLMAGQSVTIPILFTLNSNRVTDFEIRDCRDHRERLRQIEQTHEYLATPAGKRRTGLNDYIRAVSLPRLEREVAAERKTLPPSCRGQV